MNAKKIKAALAFVHYWEHQERGSERRTTLDAYRDAVRWFVLSDDEATVLRNALHIATPAAAPEPDPLWWFHYGREPGKDF